MSYTCQAPLFSVEETYSLPKEKSTARISSHNEDATIHAVPVSYRYMNGQIVKASPAFSRKTGNISREHSENQEKLAELLKKDLPKKPA